MEAIILAGGFGTRLQGVVSNVPKPMATVADRPFLSFILDELDRQGFSRVVLAVGYLHEVIEDYYGSKYKNLEIVYSKEDSPLGTGGCIKKALGLIKEEKAFVINGDTYFDIDFSLLDKSRDISIACKYMEDFSRYGEVTFDENKRITKFNEKKHVEKGCINGGIYLLSKDVFEGFDLGEKFSFEMDFLEKHISQLNIGATLFEDYFIDIGIPEDYFKANKEFKLEKALFLDRDGVINEDFGHVNKIEDFKLMDDILDIVRRYKQRGFKIIVVSNQGGIAKGMYTMEDLMTLDKYMKDVFSKNGCDIDGAYYCPHFDEDCDCRKPKPGLILKANKENNISSARSLLIGDKMSDLVAGHNAGITNLIYKKGRYEMTPVDFHFILI